MAKLYKYYIPLQFGFGDLIYYESEIEEKLSKLTLGQRIDIWLESLGYTLPQQYPDLKESGNYKREVVKESE